MARVLQAETASAAMCDESRTVYEGERNHGRRQERLSRLARGEVRRRSLQGFPVLEGAPRECRSASAVLTTNRIAAGPVSGRCARARKKLDQRPSARRRLNALPRVAADGTPALTGCTDELGRAMSPIANRSRRIRIVGLVLFVVVVAFAPWRHLPESLRSSGPRPTSIKAVLPKQAQSLGAGFSATTSAEPSYDPVCEQDPEQCAYAAMLCDDELVRTWSIRAPPAARTGADTLRATFDHIRFPRFEFSSTRCARRAPRTL